jgi:hypothetical protein
MYQAEWSTESIEKIRIEANSVTRGCPISWLLLQVLNSQRAHKTIKISDTPRAASWVIRLILFVSSCPECIVMLRKDKRFLSVILQPITYNNLAR